MLSEMGQQREAKFVNEWLMMTFPANLQWKRVRLGVLPDKKLGNLLKITLRWADAIVFDGETVFIIEAKLRSDLGALAQLEEYKVLFRDTPEFSLLKGSPVEMVLLLPYRWTDLVQAAVQRGIRVEIFRPDWLYESMGWKKFDHPEEVIE